ncbi:Pre-ATP-grasp domain [Pseudocohnilembus persalinus]|uniref:Pre-ATP-grasp domain n=1 Tax=Pseudocohnilembus persalinus TaxID=266149 RepID=A0A0V0R8F8_PSEPJ|nr:Pre-ATP-grasp domain [Pseudocohnilembus persalinus]|eukprot:KRX10781.1 Pre-ATP-grasp domain [Pseudocohnilembus persalinus]
MSYISLKSFSKEWKRKAILSVISGFILYPEIKRLYYDHFQPDSDPYAYHIKREKKQYTNNENIQLEKEFLKCGFEYFDEPAFDWSKLALWTPSYYWSNDAQYQISNVAADEIAQATFDVHSMCMQAVDFVIRHPELLSKAFDIPESLHHWIIKSWVERDKDLVSRYDFLYKEENGKLQLKFIEANADTPTILLEAGLASEIWAEQQKKQQFNMISQTITQGWKEIVKDKNYEQLVGLSYGVVKNSSFTQTEDKCNVRYLINLADECFQQEDIKLQDIRYLDEYLLGDKIKEITDQSNIASKNVVDTNKKSLIWKLYPYEWLTQESSNYYFEAKKENPNIHILEPAWKLIMANKAILPIMWSLFPNNQYLLPSYFTVDTTNYKNMISKRVFGREALSYFIIEGAEAGDIYENSKKYDENGEEIVEKHPISTTFGRPIFQKYFKSSRFKGRNLTIGSCNNKLYKFSSFDIFSFTKTKYIYNKLKFFKGAVCGLPAGIGLREDVQQITHNDSSFVPHYINYLSETSIGYQSLKNNKQNYNNNQPNGYQLDQQNDIQQQFQQNNYEEYSQNLAHQANQQGVIYEPQVQGFKCNPVQKMLREQFYGQNNSIKNMYNQFKLKEQTLTTQDPSQINLIKDQQVLDAINNQINDYTNLKGQFLKSGRGHSRTSTYLGGAGTHGEVSSAAQRNKSFGSRVRTGSSGAKFTARS